MKPDFIDFIENARKPKGEKFRRQLYIFLVCLAISIFIWVLVRLSKDYVYTVNYHLTYTHLPENLKLTGVSDSIVKLNIKVQGFDFFSEQYFRSRKRYFDVSLHDARLKYIDNHSTGYLLSSYISGEIAAQNNFPLEIYSISPDTLFFTFEKRNIKRLSAIRINSIPVGRINIRSDSAHIQPDTLPGVKNEITKYKRGK